MAVTDNENEYLNQRGLRYFWLYKLKPLFKDKVDKDGDKILSTYDFDDSYKGKIDTLDSTYAKKTEISQLMHYVGSVDTYADLTAITDAKEGHVYNVASDGMNYVYIVDPTTSTGSWDALGASFEISSISNTEIDDIMAEETT